uniref:Uncharacterized protein n=1 Tax=Rhizophora mucronata TaxID=61149 RepID=A0A2P2N9X0_RHIMU
MQVINPYNLVHIYISLATIILSLRNRKTSSTEHTTSNTLSGMTQFAKPTPQLSMTLGLGGSHVLPPYCQSCQQHKSLTSWDLLLTHIFLWIPE